MPVINALLVRWEGGWVDMPYAEATGRRREATLSIGNIKAPFQAISVARDTLNQMNSNSERVIAGIHPIDENQTPYVQWRPTPNVHLSFPNWDGTSTPQKLVAITVSQDDESAVIMYAPELKDAFTDYAERIQRWLKRMSNGAVGGSSRIASPERPIIQPHPRTNKPTATFSQATADSSGILQQIVAGDSPVLPAESRGELREWYITVTTAGSTPTRAQLLRNGAVLADVTIPAGETEASVVVSDILITPNLDRLQARIVTAGVGATGFGGQARVDGI
jgi:hypothetical protein